MSGVVNVSLVINNITKYIFSMFIWNKLFITLKFSVLS